MILIVKEVNSFVGTHQLKKKNDDLNFQLIHTDLKFHINSFFLT